MLAIINYDALETMCGETFFVVIWERKLDKEHYAGPYDNGV